MIKHTAKSIIDLKPIAQELIKLMQNTPVVAFFGDMGVGKTTFIKEICHSLGVNDTVNSPSFAIINEYATQNNQTIYHFDLYRLKNIEELYDLGCEDYFYSGAFCFIEWPEKAGVLLPEERINVIIKEEQNGDRNITFSVV